LSLPLNIKKISSPGWVVALIGIPIFIGALDLTVVSAVLPHIIYDLEIPIQTGLDEAAWIVTGYLLAYSVAMFVMGRLSDLYGRRKVYLIALCIFAVGSLMVAISDQWLARVALRFYYLFSRNRLDTSSVTLNLLIFSRIIQAFGGGAMVPVGMAIVGDLYPIGKRARILGVIAAIDTLGWVVGHLYGGIVTYYLDWRMIFWLNLPTCAIAFCLIMWVLRGLNQKNHEMKMDWVGTALVASCLTLFTIGIGGGSEVSLSMGGERADPEIIWPAIFVSFFCLAFFVFWQRHTKYPLLAPSLLKAGNFLPAGLCNFLVGCTLFIVIANVPLFINSLVADTLEQGAWDSGWLLCALTIPIALAAIPGGWLTERRGYRLPALIGIILASAGLFLMSSWHINTRYDQMIPQLALTGLGFGLTFAPITTAVVDSASPTERGIASATVLTLRLIGMTVGVSGMTTFGLKRADYLTNLLVLDSYSYEKMYQTSLEILMKVIDETFLIGAFLCLLSVIPIFFIHRHQKKPRGIKNGRLPASELPAK
jgi:EmrB/QacA subfamily drug resistance transporter